MDKKLVEHIARLSSFDLTDAQLEQYTQDLTNICKILDTVKDFDAQGVEPMVSPISMDFKFREDIPQDQDNRASFDKFACEVVDDYFMVPQVIK
ncbi:MULTISPECIES: Asp-tRNA(Asn)/Glu-tRNA(Gln) amidotransferase subunit GatC [unclassified Francisella]|uniref:Asp-tRNA(Asn)/Glu-tRNA(Gln) amidotransferase subunit GatC n=1 Tax=unclassified Francisella TaxID=2610885 RepID=UPI002E2F0560|nr:MULTISPECIES: Asp-tRNA(Asn)/Glu-tRNA(Gln) amidotransferase subunit GatC [unclassified Francisella]MED7818947.1 Asp-tRNA(Asn)/Glu-tRNA(Gln) amidotransferase subunit GatC [Francisella sp. 19S2-4]MED7829784.1 Asp-tRNA(Asn)/Glu-tRNA(Gln) amidotransferase subunit GatC [Francisella sp. 19S2-10]